MNECKKVHEKAVYANLKPGDKCEIVMMDPKTQTIIYRDSDLITLSKGPFISATLVSHGEITGNTRDGGDRGGTKPQATVHLDSEKELTQTDFPGTARPSFFFVEKGAKPVNCDLDKPNKRPRPSRIILPSDGSDDDGDDGDAEKTRSPHKKGRRPAPLNMLSLEHGAPDPRAANMAQQNGENRMKDPFARHHDENSHLDNMFNFKAPENFGDNPQFDKEQADRWREPFDGGRKRRNTRRRTRKYKSKRKQQTRKKTFRKRK